MPLRLLLLALSRRFHRMSSNFTVRWLLTRIVDWPAVYWLQHILKQHPHTRNLISTIVMICVFPLPLVSYQVHLSMSIMVPYVSLWTSWTLGLCSICWMRARFLIWMRRAFWATVLWKRCGAYIKRTSCIVMSSRPISWSILKGQSNWLILELLRYSR